MARVFVVCAFVLLAAFPATAQQAGGKTVVALTVYPMTAPKPALRYQLLPELREVTPGNAVQGYMKCFMEQNYFYFNKEMVEQREKWQTMPLKDLPVKELQRYGGWSLRQADAAARMENVDWQVLLSLKREGVYLLLPELQQLRTLASALKVRFRGEVAGRRFQDAARTAQTMFALSRHLGEHPTLIANLVGIAVGYVALGPVEEFIQQPGAPNLYWALTSLPEPLVNVRKGMEGERLFFQADFERFAPENVLTEEQLDRIVAHFQKVVHEGNSAIDFHAYVKDRAKDPKHLGAARGRLVESGLREADLKKLLPRQIILLDEKREYQERLDETSKWMVLPYWKAEKLLAGKEKRTRSLLHEALPSAQKVRRGQVLFEQRLAMLEHVEAIRLYAAAHQGKLPASLADIEVPLPDDPFTGKPFVYKVEGKKAILQGTPPKAEVKAARFNVTYEITLAGK